MVRLWPNFKANVSKNDLWIDPEWLAWLDECEVRALDYFKRKVSQPSHLIPKWQDFKPSAAPVEQAIIDRYSMRTSMRTNQERAKDQLAYRQRHKKLGLCTKCTNPVYPGIQTCYYHSGRKDAKSKAHTIIPPTNTPRLELNKRKEQLAKILNTVTELKLCPIADIAEFLMCNKSTAHNWRNKHMKKLLKED